jgi:hypothetical protein
MAWNPSPRVADCRDIARKWGMKQVMVIAIDRDAGAMDAASYGETKALCGDSHRLLNAAYDAVYNAVRDENMGSN